MSILSVSLAQKCVCMYSNVGLQIGHGWSYHENILRNHYYKRMTGLSIEVFNNRNDICMHADITHAVYANYSVS